MSRDVQQRQYDVVLVNFQNGTMVAFLKLLAYLKTITWLLDSKIAKHLTLPKTLFAN